MTELPTNNVNPLMPPQDLGSSISQIIEPLDEVRFAIAQKDWNQLRTLSLQPGGFGPEGRKEAWPFLLHAANGAGPSSGSVSPKPNRETAASTENDTPVTQSLESLPEASTIYTGDESVLHEAPHPDERQVGLDTDRSFVMYPAENGLEKSTRKLQLHNLIVAILRKRRKLSYFQGFHDVISVLYLTLQDSGDAVQEDSTQPSELLLRCGEKISLHRLRDSMGSGLEPLVGYLRLLQRLFRAADPKLAEVIEQTSPQPYFALSNLLTLFSHDIPTLPLIQRIFDYLLCRPPIYAIYLAAAIVLSRKKDIMKLEAEGEEGMMHSVLSQLPNLVADGQQESELDAKPQTTPRIGRSTSAAHSTTIIPSSRQSESRSRERSSSRSPQETREASARLESKPTNEPIGEPHAQTSSETARTLSPAPSEARSTVATTLADATSRATTPFPDPESRSEVAPSDTDEKASLRDSAASPSKTSPDGIPISLLLREADELYRKYPPSHPSIAADTIMGQNSVVLTWSEMDHTEAAVDGEERCLPSDDEAEKMVEDKSLIVLPYDPMEDVPNEEKEPVKKLPMTRKPSNALQSTLAKSVELFLKLDKRTILAGVIVIVAIGMAAYDRRSGGAVRKFSGKAGLLLLSLWNFDDWLDLAGDVLPPDDPLGSPSE